MSWLHALRGLIRRSAARRPGSRRRLALEVLEGRTLLSVYTVDRLTDAGEGDSLAGDLRYALTQARSGEDTITFGVTGTINLTGALPDLTQTVNIEGPGAELLTVRRDTGGSYRLFTVAGGTTVGISGLTLANGSASSGFGGGGIFNEGALTIVSSTLSGNYASSGYGGGGIYNAGTLTVSRSTFSGNGASHSGGGIYNGPSGALTVSDSSLSGNRVNDPSGAGGGIYNAGMLTVSGSTFSGNHTATGVGIFNSSSGTLTVSRSTFSDNSGTDGGGITNGGTLTVSRSTFSGNTAQDGGGAIKNFGTLAVSNSTFSGNSVSTFGGAISNSGTLTLNNSTVSGNRARSLGAGGGIHNSFNATLHMRNTILAGNTAATGPDLRGTLDSSGYNLIGNTQSGSGYADTDLVNVDPLLGPLQDNGGPTFTMALLPGSLAIDAGDNTDAPDFDQRGEGFPRIVNDVIDIGAFEAQAEKAGPFTPPRGKPFRLGVAALLGIPPSQPVRGIPSAARPTAAGVDAVFAKDHIVLPHAAEWRPTAVEAASRRLPDKESQPRWSDWAEGVLWPVLS